MKIKPFSKIENLLKFFALPSILKIQNSISQSKIFLNFDANRKY